MALAVTLLGLTAGVFVAGSAAASSATTTKKTTTTKKKTKTKTTTSKSTTTKATTATATTGTTTLPLAPGSNPLAAKYLVINATVHAASDHEILGSSAFPNYATGAVDNYYSMADTHVDNSPFAEGTASPADTGPIGQTAAAGNTQQPQYADARWPGNSGKASYGTQGQPYAAAEADEYRATAQASEGSIPLSGPPTSTKLAAPKGFDGRLREKLAAWKAKWQSHSHPKAPALPVKTPTLPKPPKVTTPAVTVPSTPALPVATPSVTVGAMPATPPVSAPLPAAPPAIAPHSATPSRSTMSASTAPPADGASLLESSSSAALDPTSGALVTRGESRVGRVSLGGGQIVIDGIHVTASITNDGTPKYKAAISVASATIGGVPVTIDQDGVHVSGQGTALPYQQASDSLNTALKQAGIQIFLVAPEVKQGSSCDSSGGSGGPGGVPTPTPSSSSTSSTTDQTNTNGSSSSSCDQSGMTSTTGSCDQTGTTTTGSTTTNASPLPSTSTSKSTTTSSTTTNSNTYGTSTNSTTGSCGQTDTNSTSGTCATTSAKSTKTTTTTSTTQTDTTPTTTSDGMGAPSDSSGSGEESVTATGLHIVFTQPVGSSGVPAQYAEHILGEVYLDSLAVPAGNLPSLSLDFNGGGSNGSFSSCSAKGSHSGGKRAAGGTAVGGSGSSAGGSSASGSPAGSGSSSGSSLPTSGLAGSGAQLTSGSTGGGGGSQSFPARLASALRKPLWLLLAYLVWQALVIGTGVSLRAWQREGTP